MHSPFGQVLKAIKENEPRAISLGYDVDKYKLLVFVLSAALSGLAGATKASVLGFEYGFSQAEPNALIMWDSLKLRFFFRILREVFPQDSACCTASNKHL